MPECCYDYQGVDHRSFKSEFFSAHSWNDNLGDALPYLNVVLKLYSEYKARSNLLPETYNTEPAWSTSQPNNVSVHMKAHIAHCDTITAKHIWCLIYSHVKQNLKMN